MANVDILRRAYSRLLALKQNLPKSSSVEEKYVREYHAIIDSLEKEGFELTEFKISVSEVRNRVTSYNYLSGEKMYSDKRYVEKSFFASKLDALLGYFTLTIDDKKPSIGFH
jgi:hypothetical protein